MKAPKGTYVLWYVLCAVLCVPPHCRGQTAAPDSLRVVQIVVAGNEHTRDFVILREMKTAVTSCLDFQQLELDRLRIESLGLFTKVEVLPLKTEQGVVVVVLVSERWYLFPFPILDRHEKDWSKLSYGFGLQHMNLRGRNEQLGTSIWWGYNPGYQLTFTSPWLLGNGGMLVALQAFRQRVRSLSLQLPRFAQEVQGVVVTIGQRFGYHTFVSLTAGYRQVRVDMPPPGATISAGGVDRAPQGGISASYDTRDLREYPRRGWWVSAGARQVGLPRRTAPYLVWNVDARRYQPVGKRTSLAARASGSFSHGQVPVYDRFYLGYEERIRGHFRQVAEGDSRVIVASELRFTLLPVTYFQLTAAEGLLSNYSRNLKFGVNAGLFCEAGSAWFRGDPTRRVWWRGFGAGVHFHLPYGYVLRLEYAWDGKLRGEVIVDLNVF
ncbi:MAG: BamA/TamA family outer membrane protein [Candidatus Oleimicrobiaceae bacterium]